MHATEQADFRPLKQAEFEKIRKLAYETFGLDLRAGKETLVSARLGKHIRQSGCRTFDEYYERVVADRSGESIVALIDALTTNHTSFFREPAHFEFLKAAYFPRQRSAGVINIWSAACSTGEEPYSIAMCALEELGADAAVRLRIVATDISTRVLGAAERGIYSLERFEGLPAALHRRYWLRGQGDWAGSYRARKELRALIEFRRLNLLDPASHSGAYSLIFCRNVMIYFDKPTQQQVVNNLVRFLEPGGYLLTGHAESLTGIRHPLKYVQPAVYRKAAAPGVWE
ncbi:MAG: protein-glutamate O-methyltransferase CheR [Bryobacterales bacterium]|nr:protein-glutamate O-methyltransferase CheR [Bryobacterales bacterium]